MRAIALTPNSGDERTVSACTQKAASRKQEELDTCSRLDRNYTSYHIAADLLTASNGAEHSVQSVDNHRDAL